MEIIRALKMRIYPDDVQKAKIDSTIDSCRFIYNHMLARGEHLSWYDMNHLLPAMKNYLPWLREADSMALQNACRQISTSYDKFFKHEARFPKFHSRRTARQSYTNTREQSTTTRQKSV